MLKQVPERITYAQERIIEMIKERKLRQWCIENGLTHTYIYKVGFGELNPSYKSISTMVHLIAPIEWFFYTDEELPYKVQLVPQWNPNERCKFIKEHRYDYKEVAKKYGLSELSAYNILVTERAKPSLAFIRECCKDTNPIDFFIDGEETATPTTFVPDRGDIVNIQGKLFFVISKKEASENDGYLTVSPIVQNTEKSIELVNTKTKGFINPKNLQTYILGPRCQAKFIESLPAEFSLKVLEEAKKIFE